MRLDKYLQVSHLVKRRVVAQRLCDGGRVQLNSRRAKPATPVAVGDIVEVRLGDRSIRVRVLSLPSSARDAARAQSFEILTQERQQEW